MAVSSRETESILHRLPPAGRTACVSRGSPLHHGATETHRRAREKPRITGSHGYVLQNGACMSSHARSKTTEKMTAARSIRRAALRAAGARSRLDDACISVVRSRDPAPAVSRPQAGHGDWSARGPLVSLFSSLWISEGSSCENVFAASLAELVDVGREQFAQPLETRLRRRLSRTYCSVRGMYWMYTGLRRAVVW